MNTKKKPTAPIAAIVIESGGDAFTRLDIDHPAPLDWLTKVQTFFAPSPRSFPQTMNAGHLAVQLVRFLTSHYPDAVQLIHPDEDWPEGLWCRLNCAVTNEDWQVRVTIYSGGETLWESWHCEMGQLRVETLVG